MDKKLTVKCEEVKVNNEDRTKRLKAYSEQFKKLLEKE